MNTDKIYAEQLANEYAPKDTSKVVALRKLDARAKLPATVFAYTFGIILDCRCWNVPVYEDNRRWYNLYVCFGCCCWYYRIVWNGN